jgi:hypothetical protein
VRILLYWRQYSGESSSVRLVKSFDSAKELMSTPKLLTAIASHLYAMDSSQSKDDPKDLNVAENVRSSEEHSSLEPSSFTSSASEENLSHVEHAQPIGDTLEAQEEPPLKKQRTSSISNPASSIGNLALQLNGNQSETTNSEEVENSTNIGPSERVEIIPQTAGNISQPDIEVDSNVRTPRLEAKSQH